MRVSQIVCMRNHGGCVLIAALMLVATVLATGVAEAADRQGEAQRLVFDSPYHQVDWQQTNQYKLDSHAHARSGLDVADIVRLYDQLGYGAVSFKDRHLHYPIEDYVDDPDASDVTLLPGQQFKRYRDTPPYEQHLKLWFSENDYGNQLGFEESFEQMAEDGGLVVFCHPASEIYPLYSVHVGVDWYIGYFDRYPHVLGIEVNNHDVEGSLALFDELLTHYGSDRLVVGFGVSDLIGLRNDGRLAGAGGNFGLSLVISDDNDERSLRNAIEAGRVFWIEAPEPHPDTGHVQFPRIASIETGEAHIAVDVDGPYESFRWIHANETIAEGPRITIDQVLDANPSAEPPNYIRFEITDGEGARLGSQAFYLVRP